MNRQEMTDALGDEHVLGLNPRREWLITQIMLLADAYAATFAESRMDALIRGVSEDQP